MKNSGAVEIFDTSQDLVDEELSVVVGKFLRRLDNHC